MKYQNNIAMDLYLITFTLETIKIEQTYERHKELLLELGKYFNVHLVNYDNTDSIPANAYKMAFIASGRIEDKVISNFSVFPYPITLLTDGLYNSLSASLEIATSIKSKDLKVKIIHGTPAEMAQEVLRHHHVYATKRALKGKRIGVIGSPAPWLVASHVDYYLASQRWGIKYIDIPIEELNKRFYNVTDDEIGMEASVLANRAKACQDTTPKDLLRAMRLYKATKQLCEAEKLDAITLPNITIAETLNTTGDLAISLLNDDGIPAGCEGDLQSIITVLMATLLTKQTCFMGDTCFVNAKRNELILGHCAIPIKLTDAFFIRDHNATEKGIGIQGIVHPGDITLFKCGGECLDEYFVSEGYMLENTNLMTAPRTQLKIKLAKSVEYFLQNPLGSHHVMIPGHHASIIQDFMQQNRCRLRE